MTVLDSLPSGVTYVSDAPDQGSYDNGTGIWTVGSIGNSVTLELVITVSVDAGTTGDTITNTASVSNSDQHDNNSGNNSDNASLTAGNADLMVTKQVDDSNPGVGDDVVYEITVMNLGPDGATSIIISDVLPEGVTYQSHTTAEGSYDVEKGEWDPGTLSSGDSVEIEITVRIDAGQEGNTINNTASVKSVDQEDPVPGNNSDSASLTVQDPM